MIFYLLHREFICYTIFAKNSRNYPLEAQVKLINKYNELCIFFSHNLYNLVGNHVLRSINTFLFHIIF